MIDPAEHRRQVEAWRASRYEALRRDAGWLTLAGLDWLKPGDNALGTGPGVDIRLPAGPAFAGTMAVEADGVVATGVFLHEGGPATNLPLTSDTKGAPTMLELGHLRLCLIERGGRLAVRTWDLESEARKQFDGIDHWPVDAAWRLEAKFEATPGRTVMVPDVLGFVEEEETPGDLAFQVGGAEHRLQALEGGPSGELWLVFADATNGQETYAGGRFLYAEAPDEAGRQSWSTSTRPTTRPASSVIMRTCPLPWPANRLPERVEAGSASVGRRPRLAFAPQLVQVEIALHDAAAHRRRCSPRSRSSSSASRSALMTARRISSCSLSSTCSGVRRRSILAHLGDRGRSAPPRCSCPLLQLVDQGQVVRNLRGAALRSGPGRPSQPSGRGPPHAPPARSSPDAGCPDQDGQGQPLADQRHEDDAEGEEDDEAASGDGAPHVRRQRQRRCQRDGATQPAQPRMRTVRARGAGSRSRQRAPSQRGRYVPGNTQAAARRRRSPNHGRPARPARPR